YPGDGEKEGGRHKNPFVLLHVHLPQVETPIVALRASGRKPGAATAPPPRSRSDLAKLRVRNDAGGGACRAASLGLQRFRERRVRILELIDQPPLEHIERHRRRVNVPE